MLCCCHPLRGHAWSLSCNTVVEIELLWMWIRIGALETYKICIRFTCGSCTARVPAAAVNEHFSMQDVVNVTSWILKTRNAYTPHGDVHMHTEACIRPCRWGVTMHTMPDLVVFPGIAIHSGWKCLHSARRRSADPTDPRVQAELPIDQHAA